MCNLHINITKVQLLHFIMCLGCELVCAQNLFILIVVGSHDTLRLIIKLLNL